MCDEFAPNLTIFWTEGTPYKNTNPSKVCTIYGVPNRITEDMVSRR